MIYDRTTNLIISPKPIYTRTRPEMLVGRDWLTAKLDHFLDTQDRGYFVIEGVPGIGKTCYLAHLVQQRGYIQLFVEQAPGGDNLADGLRSIAAQIVQTWNLQTWCADNVVPGMPVRANFIYRLLLMAAYHRDKTRPHEPIVLVIDGLEIAGIFPGQNILGLPTTLPVGVYIIVSHRSDNPTIATFFATQTMPIMQIRLSLDMPEHQHDIRQFLVQSTTHPRIAEFLHNHGSTASQFVDTLLRKSHGLWAYVRFVLDQIEQYNYLYLDLESLPDHLCGCYADYWLHQQKAKEQWQAVIQPLFALLCVTQEPLSISVIADILELDQQQQALIEHIVSVRWTPFLLVTHQQYEPPRYTAGDANQCALLAECCTLATLQEPARNLMTTLHAAVRQAHARIAHHYLQRWGGLEYELPWITSEYKQTPSDSYGLRHVVFHLIAAGQTQAVHRLMQLEWITKQSPHDSPSELLDWLYRKIVGKSRKTKDLSLLKWYMIREQEGDLADFLGDVTQAWQLVDRTITGQGDAVHLELALKYALMYTSVLSFSYEVPLRLLSALLEKGVWNPAQLLSYIRMMPDEMYRAQALKEVAPYISTDMMQHMLAIARTISEERERWKALAGIAPHLSPEMVLDTLAIARDIHHPGWRVLAMIGLLPYIPSERHELLVKELLKTIKTVWHANFRVDALRGLAPYLPEHLHEEALAMAKSIVDADWRALALIGLAYYLSPHFFHEVMGMWQVWSSFARTRVLAELGERLHELGSSERLLEIVQTIENPHDRVTALAGIAPYLPGFLYEQAVDIALSLKNEQEQAAAIKALAPYVPRHLLRKLQTTTRAMQDKQACIDTLISLMTVLPTEEHDALMNEMLNDVQKIGNRKQREEVRVAMAKQLADMGEHYRDRMLTMFEVMEDYREQTRVLINLAPYLDQDMLYHALSRIEAITNAYQRRQALAKLAPYLSARLLPQALDIARAIGDRCDQARVLVSLIDVIPTALREQVLEVVNHVGSDQYRAEVLVLLVAQLATQPAVGDGSMLVGKALDKAAAIETGDHRAAALAGIAPYLPVSLHQRLVDAIRATKNSHDRTLALVGVVPHLAESFLRHIWDMLRELDQSEEQVRVLIVLTPRLPAAVVRDALTFANGLQIHAQRDALLAVLVPRVAQAGLWQQALDAAWGIADAERRAQSLVGAAPYVPTLFMKQIMIAVRSMRQDEAKAQALGMLLNYLPKEDQPYVIQELIRAAQGAVWQGDAAPSKILAYFTHLAGHGEIKGVFDSLMLIVNPDDRVAALVDVLPLLPQALREQAIHQALADIGKIWANHRATALIQLVPHLPERL